MKRLIEFLILAPAAALAVPVLVDSTLKGAALLAVILTGMLTLKHASAALRHFVLIASMGALLALPILSMALPSWRVLPTWATIEIANESPAPAPVVDTDAAITDLIATTTNLSVTLPPPAEAIAHPKQNWIPLASWIWLAGGSLLGLWLAASQWSLWRLARKSGSEKSAQFAPLVDELRSELGIRQQVEVLTHPDRHMPMTWGLFKTRLLLPGEASAWSPTRLRAVLLHELAHVKRRDCLTQLLVRLTCAVHWFNPLVWIAARRIATERERACDDLVLNSGVRASEYAEHLLHIATSCDGRPLANAGALAMAKPSRLEARLTTILSRKANRRHLSPRAAFAAGAALSLCALPVAMMQAVAGEKQTGTEEEHQIPRTWVGDTVIGKVVSVSAEHGVVVIDSGKEDGRRLGETLRVLRRTKPIGTITVVDLRGSLSGCIVRSVFGASADFRNGDQVCRIQAVTKVGGWYDSNGSAEFPDVAYVWDGKGPVPWGTIIAGGTVETGRRDTYFREIGTLAPSITDEDLNLSPEALPPLTTLTDPWGNEFYISVDDTETDPPEENEGAKALYRALTNKTTTALGVSDSFDRPMSVPPVTGDHQPQPEVSDSRQSTINRLYRELGPSSSTPAKSVAERAKAVIAEHPDHPVIKTIAAELATLQIERERIIQSGFGAKHPKVIAAEAMIERLESLLVELDPRQLQEESEPRAPFVGIGAVLLRRPEGLVVAKTLEGGPAHRADKLRELDRITAVGEGADGEWVPTAGLDISAAVQLIRGKQGTVVRLKLIRDEGGQPRPVEVAINRGLIHPKAAEAADPGVAPNGEIETTIIEGDTETTIHLNPPPKPEEFIRTYSLLLADAADSEKAIRAIVGRKATLIADERTNQLIAKAEAETLELIERMIEELDAPAE